MSDSEIAAGSGIRRSTSGRRVAIGAVALLLLVIGAYAAGLITTLGHERRTATGIVGGTSRVGYGVGVHVFPMAPGQTLRFDYDVKIANGRLSISFSNYAALPAMLVTGPQFESRFLHENAAGRFVFRAEHWGLYQINVQATCGLRADCSIDYDVSWGLD